jgi:hypothetical protein
MPHPSSVVYLPISWHHFLSSICVFESYLCLELGCAWHAASQLHRNSIYLLNNTIYNYCCFSVFVVASTLQQRCWRTFTMYILPKINWFLVLDYGLFWQVHSTCTTVKRITFVGSDGRKKGQYPRTLTSLIGKSVTFVGLCSSWKKLDERWVPSISYGVVVDNAFLKKTTRSTSTAVVADVHASVPALHLVEWRQH